MWSISEKDTGGTGHIRSNYLDLRYCLLLGLAAGLVAGLVAGRMQEAQQMQSQQMKMFLLSDSNSQPRQLGCLLHLFHMQAALASYEHSVFPHV